MTLTVRRIVVAGILAGIVILLGSTQWGFIPVPTPAQRATILHIPAIIGGIMEGWLVGAIIGTIFGIFSFLTSPNPIFKDPFVSILPRIFIGITAYLAYAPLRRLNQPLALGVAAAVGTLTNTILVLTMAVVRGYMPPSVALAVGITHGIPEVVVAIIVVVAVGLALMGVELGTRRSRL
ncbi:MAG: ECF transporter S component [Chloroflexi bacterium]|nr:ECF transporter S component [Chloroflexota bacterium]MCL5075554.1 ECF transporter S component [Chloroflexota bacterium]